MSAADFVGLYNKYRLATFIGVDDWADRLSYLYSFVVILTCTIVVTSKTYLFRPIACHMPTAPAGANFKHYVEAACWVLGTIPIRSNETIPQDAKNWANLNESRRINYYQWVPFMLGLQCIMFYAPRLAWQSVTYNRLGTDLNQLIAKATNALTANTDKKRNECIQQAARSLELLLFAHRDYRHGVLASFKRSMYHTMGCLFASKRLGTWTLFSYFCIKLAYLINTLVQLYIMMIFLNYDRSMFGFAFKLLNNLLSETNWTESLYFPRLAYCPLRLRHLGSRENFYAGVCALPINMFNEKIYIFLFFWIILVMCCTVLSLIVWIIRISTRHRRSALVEKYLRLNPLPMQPSETDSHSHSLDTSFTHSDISRKSLDPTVKKNVQAFVNKFLRVDGVFLIYVMKANAGDVVTADVVGLLWQAWTTRYAGRPEWEHPSDNESDSEYEFSPTLDEMRTLTGSNNSDLGPLPAEFPGLRRRQYDTQPLHSRRSLPHRFVKRTS